MLFCIFSVPVYAAVETMPVGSVIINMGVDPQTINNSLKPYGLVHELLRKHNVPVRWVINSSKPKDGADFLINGVVYAGGTFIIPAQYITADVQSTINSWKAQGVVTAQTSAAFSVDVTYTFKSAPRWVLDASNGTIAAKYLANAGIPSSAYSFKNVAQLNNCDDIFVMPHGEPTWNTHKNLYYWNLSAKGAIWAGCHGVSLLENSAGPDITNPAITRRMNFLMTDGPSATQNAVSFLDHTAGTPPYTLNHPGHPVMQFKGRTDNAHKFGYENVYMPIKQGSGWRSSTLIGAYDANHSDIPSSTWGPVAAIAFGRGFGDNNRGWVMYEGGHDLAVSTDEHNVAAQRAFLNFSFLASLDKAPVVNFSSPVPARMVSGTTTNLIASVTATASSSFTYKWASSVGGTFSNDAAATTVFTAPTVATNTTCIITCEITDDCGRKSFENSIITIIPSQRPPVCASDVATLSTNCGAGSITINVLENDSDPDGDQLTVSSVTAGANGSFVNNGDGTITYTPNANFYGTDQATYVVNDGTGRTCSSTITVTVTGIAGTNGCSSTQFYGQVGNVTALSNIISTGTATTVAGKDNSLGDPDGVPGDNTTYTTFNTNGNILNYTLDGSLPAGSVIQIFADASVNGASFRVEQSPNGNNSWTNGVVFTVNTTDDFSEGAAKFYILNATATNIRIINLSTTGSLLFIDAIEHRIMGCVSSIPSVEPDEATTLEDMPVVIDVLDNDSDPQDLPLTISAITMQPVRGKVSINPNGTITYINLKDQPGPGSDAFSYRVCNTIGFCSTATVSVTIVPDGCGPGLYKAFDFNERVVTLNPTTDSHIRSRNTTSNYGALSSLYVKGKSNDKKRSMLYFNLSSIPANAIIDSASFSIYKTAGPGEGVALYRLTRAYTEGGVSWNRYDNTNSWTTAGGDYSSTLYATANVGALNFVYRSFNVKSLVQGWVGNSYINAGMMLTRNLEGAGTKDIIFNSKEASTNRPLLYIRYRNPGQCIAIPAYAPFSMPDTATTISTKPVTINVSRNDYDYNATGLTVSLLGTTSSMGGSLAMSGSNIIYTPRVSPVFNGIDTFRYRICSSGLCDTAMVYVRVTNSPPNANADSYILQSNTATTPSSVTASVLLNDTDPEGATLTAPSIVSGPKNGSATVSGNDIVYIPSLNFIGNDTLIYRTYEIAGGCLSLFDTALVVFTVSNRAPVAVADEVSTNPCVATTIKVTSNDVDPEDGVLTVEIVSAPTIGTAVLVNSGSMVEYTPPAGVTNTVATFTYRVCDNGMPSLCSNTVTATINIRPTPVNNAPVARRDTFDVNRNSTLYADVLSNDTDPDDNDLTTPVTVVSAPVNGTVTTYANGLVGYTPAPGFMGVDSFSYRVCDKIIAVPGCTPPPSLCAEAWVFIIVQKTPLAFADKYTTMVNTQKELNVTVNDFFGYFGPASGAITVVSAPKNGAVQVLNNGSATQVNNSLRYTPNNNFRGTDSLIYQVCDVQGNCDTAVVYVQVVPDTDGDGVADDIDIDDDNDGIPDYLEVCGAGATSFGCTTNSSDPSADDDNDGIVNYKDADWCTLNAAGTCAYLDADSDGVPDYLDRDSDNDGIPDVIEAGGVDENGDGIIDNFIDTDGDGLSQNVDANNTGAAGSGLGLGMPDFDSDGFPNHKDLDSDNDGIPDIVESYGIDANNDGRVDGFADADGDGWSNQYDGDANGDGIVENLAGVLILSYGDPGYVARSSNPGTGRPACYQLRGNTDGHGLPNFIDLDSDGDGITDATEGGIVGVTYVRSMISGGTFSHGWSDIVRALPALNLRNTDNVGRPDVYDIDSDNDGITDNAEGQPTSSFVVATELDTDGDGLVNVYDFYNGIGGNGITPYDHDADGIPDYRDTDSDNDGAPDRNEGDKRYETLTQETIDTSGDVDGDGLMDFFDIFDLRAHPCGEVVMNVCMNQLGNNGNWDGPTPGGSTVQLVQSSSSAGNRDWRNNVILPLSITNFSGTLTASVANLAWKVSNEEGVDKYILERSSDGNNFEPQAIRFPAGNGSANYTYADDLSSYANHIVYYRVKQVNIDGQVFTTKTILFNLNKMVKMVMSVYPNPVKDVATVAITSDVKDAGTILVTDMLGKTLSTRRVNIEKGSNQFTINDFGALPPGMYMVRVIMQQQTFVHKVSKQ